MQARAIAWRVPPHLCDSGTSRQRAAFELKTLDFRLEKEREAEERNLAVLQLQRNLRTIGCYKSPRTRYGRGAMTAVGA